MNCFNKKNWYFRNILFIQYFHLLAQFAIDKDRILIKIKIYDNDDDYDDDDDDDDDVVVCCRLSSSFVVVCRRRSLSFFFKLDVCHFILFSP